MRKLTMIVFLALVGLLCIPVASAEFTLPASLTVIEEDAFMGTAADVVTMQDAVISIGDFAFANIPTLQSVEIPRSVSFIGDNAFWGSENVAIYGTAGSYAESWAGDHGILFIYTALLPDSEAAKHGSALLLGWLLFGALPVTPILCDEQFDVVFGKMKIRRRFTELYPVLYDFP